MRDPISISINWTENLQFMAKNDKTDVEVVIGPQAAGENEGKNGTGPKHLFLQGLAGCSGGAIIFLLEKMRAEMPSKFTIDVMGKLTSEHPMYFETIDMIYHFDGNTDQKIIKKAVMMSEEKYCGLTYMLGKAAKINISIVLNGKRIEV